MQLLQSRTKRLLNSILLTSVIALSSCANSLDGLEILPDEPGAELVPGDGSDSFDGVGVVPQQPSPSTTEQERILANYEHLDPQHVVDTKLLKEAVLYFDANQNKFANKNYLTVIDFSKRSSVHRMFIINVKTGAVWGLPTSHGKGSDPGHDGYAEKFSNVSGSNASSLGFYKTAETYLGKHGQSLRLDGLSATNSKARARAIVVHGASYVQDRAVVQGRSLGCPAVPDAYRDRVISMIKGGSLMYAGLSGKK